MQKSSKSQQAATLTVPATAAPLFSDALEAFADSVSAYEAEPSGATWQLSAVLKTAFDRRGLNAALALVAAAANVAEPALRIAPLPDADWLAWVKAEFPPFRLGRFFFHGSHYAPRPGDGPLRLLVDAGTAFGSGEHATTQGCLRAMEMLAKRRQVARVLDMGCGSGILSLAAARLWRPAVIAVDIDKEAERVTRANACLNGVARYIRAGSGNGYKAKILTGEPPFDLIVSNILARPLRRLAPALARHLRPGGTAILSGLLARQAQSVLAAHTAHGLRLTGRIPIGEWQTLVLEK